VKSREPAAFAHVREGAGDWGAPVGHNGGAMSGDPFDLIGHIVGGQFRVEAVAGDADLSVVYRGRRLDADTRIAIKCLNLPETIPDALARALDAAFQQAYRVHDRLARGHAHIAQTITSGETRAPRTGAAVPYLVREWFDGESLAAELAGRQKEVRPMRPLEEVLGLLRGAFEAVAYAHTQGEVHLGINPANLFVASRSDGTATLKVLDFGLARMMNDFAPESPEESHSGCGLRLWLPGYAAPEQLDESLGGVGPQTDVYALALVATEALSGHKLPHFLEQVLNRALSPSPGARQADAGELWREMSSAVPPRAARATLTDAGEVMPMVAGAVARPRLKLPSEPSTGTQPMSFDATGVSSSYVPVALPRGPEPPTTATPAPPGVAGGARERAEGIETATSEPARLPPVEPDHPLHVPSKPPSLVPPLLALRSDAPALARLGLPVRLSRRALALVSAGAAAALILVAGTVAALRSHRGSAVATAAGTADSSEPAMAPSPADAPASPASPSAASSPEAPSASSPQAPPDSTAKAKPEAPFAAAAARRALDAKKREFGKCRRGRTWGHASATVTFANDGSVEKVAVAPPFAGTPTGACAADALASVRVAPFSGAPASLDYHFYVPAK